MTWSRGLSVLMCTALAACSDAPQAPIFNAPPPVQAPGNFRIGPDTLDLIPGEVRTLSAAWTGIGTQLVRIQWQSDNPSVVSVNDKGELTALTLGGANISGLLTTASGIARASIYVLVVPLGTVSVQVRAGSTGWSPDKLRIAAGTRVTWTSGPTSWSGATQDWIYLYQEGHQYPNLIDLRTGTASMLFSRPGKYWFCSGFCWDPPDGGAIEVF